MAELPPSYAQCGCTTAQADRATTAGLVCGEGVSAPWDGALAVTASSGMTLSVASGGAFIQGDDAACQGMYHIYNCGADTVTLDAADSTNPRIDLVIAQIRDSTYTGSDCDWVLTKVNGTPAPSPSAPAVPDSALVLAQVLVGAGVSTITNGNITDRRVQYTPCSTVEPTMVVYTSGGTFEKADYPWARSVRVRVVGGGGGGGVGHTTGVGERAAGGGGGGGGYAESVIDIATITATVTVTVGAGGAGGSSGDNDGFPGDPSSFGSYVVATGGSGGNEGNASSSYLPAIAGVGGSGTAGDIQSHGSPGTNGIVSTGNQAGGSGGSTPLGGGARGNLGDTTSGVGGNGNEYGGGGAGGFVAPSESYRDGGDGADGVVIVEVW